MKVDRPVSARLHTTVLRVTNLERSVDWYRNVLGMKPVYRDFSYRLVNMVGENNQQLTLWEALDKKTVITSSIHGIYPVLATPNAVTCREEMLQHGASVGPIEQEEGLVLFWVNDPDNHRIAVLEFLID